jgi:beta-lactamase class A
MRATRTGQRRLRAGLPAAWRAGDKTGTGFNPDMPDRINDVAVFWPPGRKPWVLACFYEGPTKSTEWVRPQDEAVLAEVGRLAAAFVVAT